MESTKRRMIVVAVVVCGFAVGMAGLLNYFKYRSTAERLVHERLLVTGQTVENTIQSSLALGLQFADIGTLPAALDRERATDDMIEGIDVFDTSGLLLYSTERQRLLRPVPLVWMQTIRAVGNKDWFVGDGVDSAAGMAVQNNFGLTVGYLALRYSDERLDNAVHAVGRELALLALVVFGLAATLTSFALIHVMNGLTRDVQAVKTALRAGEPVRSLNPVNPANPVNSVRSGPFGAAMQRFFDTLRGAEGQLAELRSQLERGHKP